MAALNFPSNPLDGQLYPDPAVPGSQQYVWSDAKQTWLTVFQGISSIKVTKPLFTTGDEQRLVINIAPATATEGGYMTSADKKKLDGLQPTSGTVTQITAGTGIGLPNPGDVITTTGVVALLPASQISIGGVKPGNNLSVSADGTLTVKPASSVTIGAVKAGPGVNVLPDGSMTLAPNSTFTLLDSIQTQFNGVTKQFALKTNGNLFTPSAPAGLMLFVGGLFKVPTVDYTLAGSLVTFAEAPLASQSFYGLSLT